MHFFLLKDSTACHCLKGPKKGSKVDFHPTLLLCYSLRSFLRYDELDIFPHKLEVMYIIHIPNDLSTYSCTLESVIDVGQGISVGPGRFGKMNKRRALNKRRAWKIWKRITVGQEKFDKICANLCGKKNHTIKKLLC
jgi:hypothetical protein